MDEARFTALIRKHLPFYLALADGRRTPTTPAQRHFAAARGETAAQTEHEHAFALWRQRTTHVAHTLDAQAARTALIPDARTRAAAASDVHLSERDWALAAGLTRDTVADRLKDVFGV